MLEEAAKVFKGAKEETKELNQLANKEGSVISKRAKKCSRTGAIWKPLEKGSLAAWFLNL